MNSNATASTAAASGGVAGAIVVIFVWLLSLIHVAMPSDVAAALMVVLSAGLHIGVLKYLVDPLTPAQAAARDAPALQAAPAPLAASPGPVAPAPLAQTAPAPANPPAPLPLAAQAAQPAVPA